MTRRLRYNTISTVQSIANDPQAAIPQLKDAIRDILYLVSEHAETVTDDFTVTNDVAKWYLSCENTAPITITLPQFPEDGLEVVVTRWDAEVTIKGNGKKVIDNDEMIVSVQYASPHLEFREAKDRWRADMYFPFKTDENGAIVTVDKDNEENMAALSKEVKLLNERFEEAFETRIEEEDL